MDEVTLRRLAIWQFERGEPPAQIWPRLGRSRRWFFKWLARYRAAGPEALLGLSRAHHRHPRAMWKIPLSSARSTTPCCRRR